MFPSSTWPFTESWERELSELNGATAAVDANSTRCPIPKRAAAFTNLQINKNVHSVTSSAYVCTRVGLLCALPAGKREFTAVRVGSSGATAQCGLAPDLCRGQGSRRSIVREKRLAPGDSFVSSGLE